MSFDKELRQYVDRGYHGAPIDFGKSTMLSAFGSLDAWWESQETSLSTAIDASTSPFSFSASQKDRILSLWLGNRARRQ